MMTVSVLLRSPYRYIVLLITCSRHDDLKANRAHQHRSSQRVRQ
jgi:hypothetical protein